MDSDLPDCGRRVFHAADRIFMRLTSEPEAGKRFLQSFVENPFRNDKP